MVSAGKHLYDFGPFRLDLRERMLLKDGVYVPLNLKAFETLTALVERNGRIVEKEELLRAVWPDSYVEEGTLVKNVSVLRKVLGQDDGRHYIDTFPKRGYRFTAEVRVLEDRVTVVEESPVLAPVVVMHGRRFPYGWWAAGAALLVVLVGLAWWAARGQPSGALASLKAIPLTSYPGRQNQVAFAPDGNQVAFVWDGPQGGSSHIYVKQVGSEKLLQLTHGAAADSRPAWSPDGRTVAFLRSTAQKREWYLISALGGAERKVAEVFPYFDLGNGNSAYYHPEGQSLAIVDKASPADPAGIFLLSLDSLSRTLVSYKMSLKLGLDSHTR